MSYLDKAYFLSCKHPLGHNSDCKAPNGVCYRGRIDVDVYCFTLEHSRSKKGAIILMIIGLIPVMISPITTAVNRGEVGIIVAN